MNPVSVKIEKKWNTLGVWPFTTTLHPIYEENSKRPICM